MLSYKVIIKPSACGFGRASNPQTTEICVHGRLEVKRWHLHPYMENNDRVLSLFCIIILFCAFILIRILVRRFTGTENTVLYFETVLLLSTRRCKASVAIYKTGLPSAALC